ncbi:MAG TPA: SDR family oxidoreductase [Sphingomonadaceae bacterium]|nr:SDR family oxidoreductase [Sphingomonadaceae bacterium]
MIIVTGASGAFGRAAAERLMELVPANQLILTSRTPAKLGDLAARGAKVRFADFDRPETLDEAFAGGTKMLLISTARVGSRVGQHKNAIDRAVAAGVRHIVYTSIIGAAEAANPALVKRDHRATEELIEASGAAWTFLRDSQYAEAIAGAVTPGALANGRLPDNAHDGQIAFVSRDDCVACAAGVLSQDGHENQTYDITGPELLTFPKAMAIASEITGKPIDVIPVDDEQMFAHFDSLGIPRVASDDVPDGPIPWSSDDMVTFGQSIREGFFNKLTDHVERITGRKPKPLREVMLAYRDTWPV